MGFLLLFYDGPLTGGNAANFSRRLDGRDVRHPLCRFLDIALYVRQPELVEFSCAVLRFSTALNRAGAIA